MLVDGVPTRTIRLAEDGWAVDILDQTKLPFAVVQRRLETCTEVAEAISTMRVRGAPLIGAAAAFGMCLAVRADASDAGIAAASEQLRATRPTGVNLANALTALERHLAAIDVTRRPDATYAWAKQWCEEDVAINAAIGEHGAPILHAKAKDAGRTLNVLTHCNAGWLATVDWGTALSPVYRAHHEGLKVHVWVSETRPRNQGALTAWELGQEAVPHTVVTDNACGHLMQSGAVDLCIVGTDRTTASGDVCNKIGTYLKALAAHEHDVPFYAAVPGHSVDWSPIGPDEIPIEERGADEVTEVRGRTTSGDSSGSVRIVSDGTVVRNPAFDVTPAHLVTGLVTERGVCAANREALATLFDRPPI